MRENEFGVISEIVRSESSLSFSDLLANRDFMANVERFGWTAEKTARALIQAQAAKRREHLRELARGNPLCGSYPVEVSRYRGLLMIVGIRHSLTGRGGVQPEYQRQISNLVRNNPLDWFVEEGVSRDFGLTDVPNSQELSDVGEFTRSFVDGVSGGRLKQLGALLGNAAKAAKNTVAVLISMMPDAEIRSWQSELTEKAKTDYRYHANLYVFDSELKLPEPLDMEVKYILGNPGCGPDYLMDRSRIQAAQVRARLFDGDPRGLVCGMQHASQVKYFWENPDYDPRGVVRKVFEVLG